MKNRTIALFALIATASLQGCASMMHLPMGQHSTQAKAEATARAEQVTVLTKGHDFDAGNAEAKIFKDRNELYSWAAGRGHIATRVLAAAKSIDFAENTLVFVSSGPQPSAGYELNLASDKVDYANASGALDLILTQPPMNQNYTSTPASPYLLLKVPAYRYEQIALDYVACDMRQSAYASE